MAKDILMYKLKIAVGISGRVTVLEGFPDDEKHAGLHELVSDFEENIELDEPAGIYTALMTVNTVTYKDPQDDSVTLEILNLTSVSESERAKDNIKLATAQIVAGLVNQGSNKDAIVSMALDIVEIIDKQVEERLK